MCLVNTFISIFAVKFTRLIMEAMQELRILSKGRITDLSKGFSLGGSSFSIFVRPKSVTMETNVLVKCQLICDKSESDFPVPIGDWTPGAIVKISPNGISLDDYDIFWGAGETIK